MIKKIMQLIAEWKHRRHLAKKLKELRKRDPFIY